MNVQGYKQPAEEMATHTTLPVQQPQASTYNHPCEDLLDGQRRREYLDIVVPLYRASIKGDLEAAKVIFDQDQRDLVRYSITEKKETPLHVAVARGGPTLGKRVAFATARRTGGNLAAARRSTKFVSYLVNMMETVDLELQNVDGNTAFCIAAISGNVGIAKIMFEKNRALPTICGSKNMTPLYLAAFHGNRAMVTFLYDKSDRTRSDVWTNGVMDGILLKCIQADIFDVALRILEDNEELPQDKHLWDVLHLLARNAKAFPKSRQFHEAEIITSWEELWRLVTGPAKESNPTLFLRLLWKRIMKNSKDVIDEILLGPMIEKDKMETHPSQILFIAAKSNNTQFLVELIDEYPDLIWKRNDDGQTIFHIAVAHRHDDIYNLLYEIGSMKDLITPMTDKEGNNMLHLVGKAPQINAYEDWVTPPFQMLTDFLWYQEVSHILPPSCREMWNAAGQTPHEVFVENHNKLFLDGTKWIYDSINISMVIAALVCGIGFAVVYAIPGGFDQDNGLPVLLHNRYFIAFIVMDAISFIFSASSILQFLSVILSRHHRQMQVLFGRWVVAQLFLLSSVFFLGMAFILSFFILYRKSTWTYIFYAIAYLTMIAYTYECLAIVLNSARLTFGATLFINSHMLYRNK
ncbi:putative ankyrin repeat-containing domain, PGG domain, ankyrin repeat-containing domain superfamily [Helianthus anomalus]